MVYSVVSYTAEVNGAFDVVGAVVAVVVGFKVDVLVLVASVEEEEEEELTVGVEVGSSKQEQAELTLSGLSPQFSR
jgi:hypothetical protein